MKWPGEQSIEGFPPGPGKEVTFAPTSSRRPGRRGDRLSPKDSDEDFGEWWRVGNRLGRVGGRQKESAKKVVGLPAYVADRCRNSVIGSRSRRYSVIGARISASTDQISLEAVVGDQIVLDDDGEARSRLIFRCRGSVSPWWLSAAFTATVIPADFVMSRQMLARIKERVASQKVRDRVSDLAAAIRHSEGTIGPS
jgi:hypothetical protein